MCLHVQTYANLFEAARQSRLRPAAQLLLPRNKQSQIGFELFADTTIYLPDHSLTTDLLQVEIVPTCLTYKDATPQATHEDFVRTVGHLLYYSSPGGTLVDV